MTQDAVVQGATWSRGVFSFIRKMRFEPAVVAVLICFAVPLLILAADNPDSSAIGTRTVTGLVRDIACPLQNKKSTTTTYSKDCIAMCAKSGSPMGILTEDGSVYVPVTESMPDTGQDALKPFIGEQVQATGKVFERNGGHAIAISEIHKLPSAAAGK
jgi:hypothetical protein